MNCTKSNMVSRLRRLGSEAGMPARWDLGLSEVTSDWDLYDFAKEVALALVARHSLDTWLSTYIRLCREHGAGAVTFAAED